MTPRNDNGWHVPTPQRWFAYAAGIPAIVLGALLTFSLWFMMFGAPLLAVGILAVKNVQRSRNAGASHPAWAVGSLALVELGLAAAVLSLFGTRTAPLTVALVAPGVITGGASLLLWKTSQQMPSPPPPFRSTVHVAGGPTP